MSNDRTYQTWEDFQRREIRPIRSFYEDLDDIMDDQFFNYIDESAEGCEIKDRQPDWEG